MRPRVIHPDEDFEPPVEALVHDEVTVSKTPPVVVDYCRAPRSGRASWECGYRARTCRGETVRCARCRFRYCSRHQGTHAGRIYVPVYTWRKFHRDLLNALTKKAKGLVKNMRNPDVQFDPEDQKLEEEGGDEMESDENRPVLCGCCSDQIGEQGGEGFDGILMLCGDCYTCLDAWDRRGMRGRKCLKRSRRAA